MPFINYSSHFLRNSLNINKSIAQNMYSRKHIPYYLLQGKQVNIIELIQKNELWRARVIDL